MDNTWWFTEAFTENAQKLYNLLFTRGFNAVELKIQLDSGIFSVADINLAAYRYVDDCHGIADFNAYNYDHLFDHASLPIGCKHNPLMSK